MNVAAPVPAAPVARAALLAASLVAALALGFGHRRQVPEAVRLGAALGAGRSEVGAMGSGQPGFRVRLPVAGRHKRIRGFDDAAPPALPSFALDGPVLERPSIGAAEVHGQLELSAFVFETGPPRAPGAESPSTRPGPRAGEPIWRLAAHLPGRRATPQGSSSLAA